MCGFVVIVGDFAAGAAKASSKFITHRGPDEFGDFNYRNIQVATRRLVIQDLEGGQQPFTNLSKTKILAYNGEIFNSRSLRSQLKDTGYNFKSHHSDTETLFSILSKNKLNLLKDLNGMFSFAFIDLESNNLKICRDYAGQKPLFWSLVNNSLVIASEIEPIKYLTKNYKLNMNGISSFIQNGYIPFDQTVFSNINKVKPGEMIDFNLADMTYVKQNISLFSPENYCPGSAKNIDINHLSDLIVNATLQWSASDVPISVSLSDGIDSSLITAILAKNGVKDLSTYTLSFESGNFKNTVHNPLPKLFHLPHHEISITPHKIKENLLEMVKSLGEPYAGGMPSWFVYKEMSHKVKVALTGSGADELFDNYGKAKLINRISKFNLFNAYSAYQKIVGSVSKNSSIQSNARYLIEGIHKSIHKEPGTFLNKVSLLDANNMILDRSKNEILDSFISKKNLGLYDFVFCYDFNTQLPEEFLFMTDRYSMFHSVESRSPFLDLDLIKYICSFDRKTLVANGSKFYLKEIAKNWLDKSLLNQPKKGFTLPEHYLMKNELKDFVNYFLSKESVHSHNILDYDVVKIWKLRFYSEPNNNYVTNVMWRIFILQIWLSQQNHKS